MPHLYFRYLYSAIRYTICGLACLSFLSNACPAQNRTKPLSLFLELGGAAGLASLNIEQVFSDRGTIHFAYRLGASGFPIDRNNGMVLVIPAGIHMITGEKAHKLDLSLGQNLSITTKRKAHLMTTMGLGYRYQKTKKPFFFRIAYTPLISYLFTFQYQHWAGITLGYSLRP